MAQTVDNKPELKQEVLDKVTNLLTRSAFVPGIDFNRWPSFLEAEKPKIESANTDEDFQNAVNAALHKFGASHIVLTTPRQGEIRKTGKTVGIGITSQTTEDGLMIVRTVPGASADRAGLKPGDIITLVDGKPVEGVKGIPGPAGTYVKLKVKHRDGKVEDYSLVRRAFSTVRPEELTFIGEDTAKLSIYTFDFTYDAERVENLMQKASKKRNLILDLRDNGGGAVVNLQHLLGLFLPENTPVGTFITRRMADRYVDATKGKITDIVEIAKWSDSKVKPMRNRNIELYKGNVAVLVNGLSGSASEIAAAALRDTIGATVVGRKSAGAVLVSVIVPASNGFMLQYPLSDYVTIKGLRLEGNGVTPDVEVNEPRYRLPDTPDEAATKAAEILTRIASKKGAAVGSSN
jgi:carboxyl-terminal processing protease